MRLAGSGQEWVLAHFNLSTREAESTRVQVVVRDNNVDQALRALKKKMQREGIFREMKLRNYYEKPSEKRARKKAQRESGVVVAPRPRPER